MSNRRAALLGLGAASLALSGCVEGMFFHPSNSAYPLPGNLAQAPKDVWFQTADGSKLHAWWLSAPRARATVVHAHGNAENIGNHLPFVAWLPAAGFNVLTFDYRGFGRSEGKPSLQGVVQDLRSAIAEARRQSADQPLVLLGQSLGGATAIRAAAQEHQSGAQDIAALIADSPFSSYRGIAQDAAGGGALGWLAQLAAKALPDESHDPLAAIAQVRCPVLFIHGDHDRVIPVVHSLRLHAAAKEPKSLLRIDDGQHIDGLLRVAVQAHVVQTLETTLRG